jgi:hypothetical protein
MLFNLCAIELTIELVGLMSTFIGLGVVYGVLKSKINAMEDKQVVLDKKAAEAMKGWQENHDRALILEQAAAASCTWHEGWERRCQSFREDCMAIRRAEHEEFKLTASELFRAIDGIKKDTAEMRADLRVLATEISKPNGTKKHDGNNQ